ncbi:MAG: MYXO-CTERM sorting domain-containing protein [Myxococcales bacterium]
MVTNRGLVFKNPEGSPSPFSLRCNEAYGEAATSVPWVTTDGANGLTVATNKSVLTSVDGACSFTTSFDAASMAPLGGYLGGVTESSAKPERLVLSTLAKPDVSGIWASEDFGATWSVLYRFPNLDTYSGLLAAPSNAQRIYATGSGLNLDTQQIWSLWLVSSDGGSSWSQRQTDSDLTPALVHPQNPDVVFAYEFISGTEGARLWRSTDAGQTFAQITEVPKPFTSFLSSADGTEVWFGADGLYHSRDGGLTFTREYPEFQAVRCLAEHAGELWICANQLPNLEGVFVRHVGSDAFEQAMVFTDVRENKACGGDLDSVCRVPWLDWKIEIFPDGLDAGVQADASVPEDAGADAGPAAGSHGDGCGCDVPGQSHGPQRGLFGAGILLAAWSIARRRRH